MRAEVDGISFGPDAEGYRFDVNVGSTTDRPMEAHRVALDDSTFDDSTLGVSLRDAGFAMEPHVQYVPRSYRGTDVCRHLAAAEAVVALRERPVGISWRTPRVGAACERDPTAAQTRLRAAMDTLETRMADPVFRARALLVARSARAEFAARVDAAALRDLIPRPGRRAGVAPGAARGRYGLIANSARQPFCT